MRDFTCPNCGQRLAFENSKCLSCGSALGFSLDEGALLVIARGEDSAHGGAVDASQYRLCANLFAAKCNWLVEASADVFEDRLCTSCALTRTHPNVADTVAMAAFAAAEQAKRRLLAELVDLKLPIVGRDEDPEFGLAFDLLSSHDEKVFTGHEDGLITLDLAEGDDVHREQLRVSMDEPDRTLLGHFRHEIGGFDTIIEMWLPIAWSLNMVNRSMGHDDLYPFVLAGPLLEKMQFIHTAIQEVTTDPVKLAAASGGSAP